jgi:hypothetical protein
MLETSVDLVVSFSKKYNKGRSHLDNPDFLTLKCIKRLHRHTFIASLWDLTVTTPQIEAIKPTLHQILHQNYILDITYTVTKAPIEITNIKAL